MSGIWDMKHFGKGNYLASVYLGIGIKQGKKERS